MDALASEAAAGVADSVVTRLGQKNGQDLKSDGYRTWIVPKGRKADQETLKAYVNSKLCLVRLTLTPTPTLTRTQTRTRTLPLPFPQALIAQRVYQGLWRIVEHDGPRPHRVPPPKVRVRVGVRVS